MPITVTRTLTAMLGTPASPASIAAAGTAHGNLDHTATAGTIDVSIGMAIIIGPSAPASNISIQFQFTEDGTNYVNDGAPISLAASGNQPYYYRYDPPPAAKGSQVSITNGITNAITAWIQGTVLSVS